MKPTRNPILSARFTSTSTSVRSKSFAFFVVLSAATTSLHAANGTWQSAPTSGNWVASGGELNWTNGANLFPGSTSVLTNADTATFLTSGTTAVTINSATLNVRSITFGTVASPSAFTIGSTVGNSLFLSSGGTVSIVSGVTVAGAAETINAPIVLAPASPTTAGTYTFSNASGLVGSILNVGGAISGGTTTQDVALTLTGSSVTANTISGAISNGGAVGGVSVAKTSTGTWALTGINTHTGTTTISGGVTSGGSVSSIVSLRGANGALTTTSAINLNGGVFRLDNTLANGAPNSNRVNDAAAINANAGPNVISYTHDATASVNYSENLGALNLSGGDLSISKSQAAVGQTSALTFSSFNRTGISTMAATDSGNLGSAANAQNRIILSGQSNSTFLGGWATFGGQGQFAAYDTTRGIIGATITGIGGVTAAASSATANYRAGTATVLATANGIYSGNTLAFPAGATGGALDLNGSTFKLSSGGITTATDLGASYTITNGTLTAADTASPTTLYLHSRATNGNNLSISAVFADPTGGGALNIVKGGASGVTLNGANTFSGTTSINSASLTLNNALALQNSTLNYNNHGGNLALTNVATNYSIGGLSGAQNLQVQGNLVTGLTLGNSNGGTGTNASYAGTLTTANAIALTKVGANTQTFTGTLTTNGNSVTLAGGTLALGSATALGTTGNVNFSGGTLRLFGTTDYSARIASGTSTGAVSIDTNGQSVTFATALTASQSAGLKKLGTGTLTLAPANAYTGDTTVSGGTLAVSGTSIPDAGRVLINTGTIALTGTEVVNTLYFGNLPQAAGLWGAPGTPGATFTDASFSGTGLLSVTTLGPPLSGGYSTWATDNGVTGGVNGDSDNDGIPNGVEYGLNTNPAGSDGAPGTYTGTLLTFNKRIATSGNSDLSYRIEVSTDLGVTIPWTEVAGYVQNTGSAISANIPNGPAKNFGRLRVIINP